MELSGKKEFSPRNEELSFSRGDRVALVFDGHAEYGWIRWLGQNSESELMAGVEFVSWYSLIKILKIIWRF